MHTHTHTHTQCIYVYILCVHTFTFAAQTLTNMHKYTDQSLASPHMVISPSKRVKGLNEDVFVTQLVVRAEAIDLEFQVRKQVKESEERERQTE
jgi:hypothetical protein